MNQPEYSPLVGMVNIQEVADACRVSVATINRWVKAGILPEPRRFGRRCVRWRSKSQPLLARFGPRLAPRVANKDKRGTTL